MVAWQCQGLGPALTPLTTSGMALECPLVSRPRHASCDLVTRALMEICPGKGVLKREKFPNTRKHFHCQVCGEPWKHRGQHNHHRLNGHAFEQALGRW